MSDDIVATPKALTAAENVAKDAELREEIAKKQARITELIGYIHVSNDHPDYKVVQELEKVNELLRIVTCAVSLGVANCSACGGTTWHAEDGDCPNDGDRQEFFRRTWPQLVDLPIT